MGEMGGVSAFVLLVGVGPSLGRVGVRLGSVLRLPARRTLDMCWWEGVCWDFRAMLWVTLGAVCVGEFGGVFWWGILLRFARGDGGGGSYASFPYLVSRSVHRVCVGWWGVVSRWGGGGYLCLNEFCECEFATL